MALADEAEPWPPYSGNVATLVQAHRKLRHVWADEIAIDLAGAGVIDGLMPAQGLTVIYGETNSGKTFACIDMACRIASGMDFYGMPVSQGVVVYVAAEAAESVQRRIWAWKHYHQVEHLPVLVVTDSVDLLTNDAEALAALIVEAGGGEHVAMTIIDTLAVTMGGNENAPDDMGAYVIACQDIRRAANTHVLIVHHTGKDAARGARGHSSLRAATDVELECEAGAVTVTKMRDGTQKGMRYGFRLEDVELGVNSMGRVVHTAVALPLDQAPQKAGKPDKLTPKQKTIFECLATALLDHGQDAPLARDIPRNARVVALAMWCEVAMRYLPADKPGFRRNEDFARTVQALQAKSLVKHADGWCWLP
jgi:hypothetical protein